MPISPRTGLRQQFGPSGGQWVLSIAAVIGVSACSGESPTPITGAGGGSGVGGTPVLASGGTGFGGAVSGGSPGTGGAMPNQNGGSGQGGVATGGQGPGATGGKASNVGGAQTVGGTSTTGGASAVGGSVTGGKSPAGGSTNGGTSTGGKSAQGGLAAGGLGTGGLAAGGISAGGISAGGISAGGLAAGGAAIGGKSSTGGAATGGSSSTGGAATGGSTGGVTLCPGATKTVTVAKDGSGQYATVQAAISSISSSNSSLVEVHVKAGTYNEQVTIDRPFVCLTGASATSTIITHTIDTNIVTGGTVLLTGNDFSAANITFQNSAPDGSEQRVALMAKGQRQQFYNCRFISYQDTLYTNTGTQYFRDCYIQGNTDYIFGDATAVFQNCTMYNASQGTAIVAPRTPQNTSYGFVFLGGQLTAASAVGTARVNLGRPWGPYAAAAFLNVAMGAHITAAGWTTMSGNDLTNTRFREYKSTGAGANTSNATRSTRQLSDAQAANYTVKNVLGSWTPGYSQ